MSTDDALIRRAEQWIARMEQTMAECAADLARAVAEGVGGADEPCDPCAEMVKDIALYRDLLAAVRAREGWTCGSCARCAVESQPSGARRLYCMEHGWPPVQPSDFCAWWQPQQIEDGDEAPPSPPDGAQEDC